MLAVTSPKIVYVISTDAPRRQAKTYRLDEVTLLSVSLTTGDDGSALLLTALDVVHDSVVLGLRDLRTLVGSSLEWITAYQLIPLCARLSYSPDLKLGGGSLELLGELVVDALLNVDSRTSATCLTVVEADLQFRVMCWER
jgi:hypothetical protein